jgi:hypothetical protein
MSGMHLGASLRRAVRERAQETCEYCLFPERYAAASHEVDHIYAVKHGGPTEEANLALACILCNGWKGTDLASIDPDDATIVRLYHPRSDNWHEHFVFEAGVIKPLTSIGRVTVRLLRINEEDRVVDRRDLAEIGELRIPTQPSNG